jgi:hypothetical protein
VIHFFGDGCNKGKLTGAARKEIANLGIVADKCAKGLSRDACAAGLFQYTTSLSDWLPKDKQMLALGGLFLETALTEISLLYSVIPVRLGIATRGRAGSVARAGASGRNKDRLVLGGRCQNFGQCGSLETDQRLL